ncbi:hypothetical protein [Gudongella sp. SC589]|uniref:hypothetical protein n=1 Tax=Gudongella sp. SC589 TaxID=3385990 RepID=UPI003904A3E8
MKKTVKNRNGMALPLVIMVILVTMILGVSLLSIGLADTKFTMAQENKIQANYLARAGVDDIADYIIENKALPVVDPDEEITFTKGSYIITNLEEIAGSNPKDSVFVIEATSTVQSATSDVKLTMSFDNPSDLFDKAIYTFDDLDISKMNSVQGDIASAGSVILKENKDNFDTNQYTVESNASFDYGYSQFPITMPGTYQTSYTATLSATATISSDGNYNSITVPNNTTLTFFTGGENDVLEIGIHRFSTGNSGVVQVTGEGILKLYVGELLESKGSFYVEDTAELEIYGYQDSTIDFQTPLLVENSDPNKTRLYLDEGCELILQANGTFHFYVHGPEATISMQSAQTTVYGAIVGNIYKGSNVSQAMGSVIYQAPDDSWDLADPQVRKRFYE